MKRTLILGASPNPERFSYKAVVALQKHGHEVIPIGNKQGLINKIEILNGKPDIKEVDIISIYLNPSHQEEYYDYIIYLKPKRIIFNPGTENFDLELLATKSGIL